MKPIASTCSPKTAKPPCLDRSFDDMCENCPAREYSQEKSRYQKLAEGR